MMRFEQVCKRYWHDHSRHWVQALHNATLSIQENEFVCLLGPSGSGKSTLLNLMAGFERPDSGCVSFGGQEVTGPGPDRGVVFQDHALFPWLTVEGNVGFGLRHRALSADERRARVDAVLRLVGMERFARARPYALSGGMKQRVSLARILAMEPKALLMDEPFGALDALARDRLQDELIRIWQTHRTSVLFVTHSVQEAAYLADRVMLLGPAPQSYRGELLIPLARPRDRASEEMRAVIHSLNEGLASLPCCVPPADLERWSVAQKENDIP
mgnify:CR=1 FL=1